MTRIPTIVGKIQGDVVIGVQKKQTIKKKRGAHSKREHFPKVRAPILSSLRTRVLSISCGTDIKTRSIVRRRNRPPILLAYLYQQ